MDAIDQSFSRALNAETEARLRTVAESITRATVTGASEAMLETGAEASPALSRAMGDLVQNASYEAAQGFDRAVYDVQNGNAGIAPRSSVLAAVGTSSSWLVALPALLVAANVALVLLLVAALGWALLSLQKERRRAQQHADLTVKLTDAIKAADGAPWFSDFCRYISNATREVRPANDAAPEGRRDALLAVARVCSEVFTLYNYARSSLRASRSVCNE